MKVKVKKGTCPAVLSVAIDKLLSNVSKPNTTPFYHTPSVSANRRRTC